MAQLQPTAEALPIVHAHGVLKSLNTTTAGEQSDQKAPRHDFLV
jgi:hypothetical protein